MTGPLFQCSASIDIAKGMDLPPDAPTDAAERHDHYLAELQVKQMERSGGHA